MSDLIRRVFWEETSDILVEAEGNTLWPSRGAIKPRNAARWSMSFGDSVIVLFVCSASDVGKPRSRCLSPLHNVNVPGNNKSKQLIIFNRLLFLLITITYMPHILAIYKVQLWSSCISTFSSKPYITSSTMVYFPPLLLLLLHRPLLIEFHVHLLL
jgi:hypothetical protein